LYLAAEQKFSASLGAETRECILGATRPSTCKFRK
jgi:hypothetical protein